LAVTGATCGAGLKTLSQLAAGCGAWGGIAGKACWFRGLNASFRAVNGGLVSEAAKAKPLDGPN
jgi:hypothetical protein